MGTQTMDHGTRTTRWVLDPAHTLVEFSAKHMMITTVKGRFSGVEGEIVVDEANPDRSKVEVEIDASTLQTGTEQRDDHLRSADFLDVESHPRILFKSRKVEGAYAERGDGFRVVGDLTIRDQSREVVLDAIYEGRGKDPWGGERVSFTADTRFDRREYGLTWNQALETGGVLVGNEIRIHIEAQAVNES